MAEPLSVLRERFAQPDAGDVMLRQYQELLDAYRPEAGKPVPTGFLDAVSNVGAGLARDIPRAANWFAEQARQSPEQAQAQLRGVLGSVGKYVAEIPQNAFGASERFRTTGEYDAGPILDAALLGTSGGMFGAGAKPGEMVLGAGRVRKRVPPRPVMDDLPPPPIGHNMPPPEAALAPEPVIPAVDRLPRPQPATRSTEIPDIRGLPVDEAVALARNQHHLIKAGEQSEGFYVGGPRDLTSKQWLNKKRAGFDAYVAADPRGGDWYDRYRTGVTEVTGGDPVQNRWMSSQEGQWSAGVDPQSEVQFALKENNASIAGMPVKSSMPAQHAAHLRALAAKDPDLYQLGDKTGEYARQVSPDQPLPPGGTGVNDFRHARNFGYTEKSGEPQKGSLTDAGHRFLDYETALAVDRANRTNLGGRSDWTGEQLQAAPWVRQKALDLMSRNSALTYDDAFQRANKTIADYFDKHTAFATHEAIPGADTGHMTGSVQATPLQRMQYTADPASTWATAPGGRDAIYSGMGVEGTGNFMRVRPTQDMQGYYPTPAGNIETNPGFAARPLVAFDLGKGGTKTVPPADQALLNSGEAVRAYLDAQNAGAWHKPWTGGRVGDSNSLFFPREGKASVAEMQQLQGIASKHGLGDVADTGQGITSTSFWPKPDEAVGKAVGKAAKKGEFGDLGEPQRVKVDSDIVNYVDEWKAGKGSGAATTKLLDYVNKTPQMRAALNDNPYLAERATAKLARDEKWAKQWGAPREDIQNARRIIGEGPGWIDRLEAALKNGAVLPAVAAAILGTSQLQSWGHGE